MNWDKLISILDIVSAIGLIVCLNLVTRYRIAWLFYSFVTIFFVAVTAYRHLPGLTLMGLVLIVTGVINYCTWNKKKNVN
jgi:hypothetical protein